MTDFTRNLDGAHACADAARKNLAVVCIQAAKAFGLDTAEQTGEQERIVAALNAALNGLTGMTRRLQAEIDARDAGR